MYIYIYIYEGEPYNTYAYLKRIKDFYRGVFDTETS